MSCDCDTCERSRRCAEITRSENVEQMAKLIEELLNGLIEAEEELSIYHASELEL